MFKRLALLALGGVHYWRIRPTCAAVSRRQVGHLSFRVHVLFFLSGLSCLRSWCLVVLPCKGPGDRVRLCLWQSPAQSTKPWALL
ncbi:hypothetical protein CPB84DRAFT_1780045, partial [Gymnopilus junonius]